MNKTTQNTYYKTSLFVIAVAIVISSLLSYWVATVVSDSKAEEAAASLHNEEHSPRMMVHISSGIDQPHNVMMGLNKALKASEAGSEVFVFMDVEATDLVLKTTNITFADFAPSQTLIADLIEKGVQVYVCPHCLMVNGGKMEEVQDGVQELTMEAMMAFSSTGNLTTLDY